MSVCPCVYPFPVWRTFEFHFVFGNYGENCYKDLAHFFVCFFVFSFVRATWLMGSLFPDQGLNPGPWHWERGVLTTGPPGNSLSFSSFDWPENRRVEDREESRVQRSPTPEQASVMHRAPWAHCHLSSSLGSWQAKGFPFYSRGNWGWGWQYNHPVMHLERTSSRCLRTGGGLQWVNTERTSFSWTNWIPLSLKDMAKSCLPGRMSSGHLLSSSDGWNQITGGEPSALESLCSTEADKSAIIGASLVAQWLRVRLPMQGTRVRALVWDDPTCHGVTRPVSHNCWACTSGACAPQQERPR